MTSLDLRSEENTEPPRASRALLLVALLLILCLGGLGFLTYRILQRTSQDKSVPMVEIARAVLASEPGIMDKES